jgi:hypothetical protein
VIDIFTAPEILQRNFKQVTGERQLITIVMQNIETYCFATQVNCDEIDIAFALTGGQTRWINADDTKIDFQPKLNRPITFGDILIELPQGFINLATPAGFIPLVDLLYTQGQISRKQLN